MMPMNSIHVSKVTKLLVEDSESSVPHQVKLMEMWENCIKSPMRTDYI
jgi:hypothetical protein